MCWTKKTIETLSVIAGLLFVQACSHPIEIVGEGDVWSTGGRSCTFEDHALMQENCTNNYVISAYQETYYAEPRDGWQFGHWENYCTDADDNSCTFDIDAATVQLFWGQIAPPLKAVFTEDSGAPITDTVVAHGKEWAQVALFTSLTWYEIDAVCPSANGGVCTTNSLNGWDMTGWTWAGMDEIYALFNAYGADPPMGPGIDGQFTSCDPDNWVGQFFSDGWTPTAIGGSGGNDESLSGWLRTIAIQFEEIAFSAGLENSVPGTPSCIETPPQAGTYYLDMNHSGSNGGVWFYRTL